MLFDIDTAYGEARAVHAHNRGYFAIFKKHPGPGRRRQELFAMDQLETVVSSLHNTSDVYLSQASFVRKSRRSNALGNLGCAFVDIDCYKLGIAVDEKIANELIEKAVCWGIPRPSFIISSGRGLYCKWLFTEPLSASHVFQWDALQHVLVSLYHAIGADIAARDSSRVLRLVGSVNGSVDGGASVRPIWSSGQRYSFDELSAAAASADIPSIKSRVITSMSDGTSEFCAEREIKRIQARVKKLQSTDPTTHKDLLRQQMHVIQHLTDFSQQREPFMLSGMGLQALNWRRFIDLRDLAIMRGGVNKGSRDLTLFWMGVFLAHSGVVNSQNFHAEMLDLASGFPGTDFKPMQDNSMSTLFEKIQAKQKGEKVVFQGHLYNALYTPTNERLIETFEITQEEQTKLTTVIGEAEKLRRADAKVPGRCQRRADRVTWRLNANMLAKEATANGQKPNITAIAAEVGVHKTQISRLLAGVIGKPRKKRACKAKTHRSKFNQQLDEALHIDSNSGFNEHVSHAHQITQLVHDLDPCLTSINRIPGQRYAFKSKKQWRMEQAANQAAAHPQNDHSAAIEASPKCITHTCDILDKSIPKTTISSTFYPVVAVFAVSKEEQAESGVLGEKEVQTAVQCGRPFLEPKTQQNTDLHGAEQYMRDACDIDDALTQNDPHKADLDQVVAHGSANISDDEAADLFTKKLLSGYKWKNSINSGLNKDISSATHSVVTYRADYPANKKPPTKPVFIKPIYKPAPSGEVSRKTFEDLRQEIVSESIAAKEEAAARTRYEAELSAAQQHQDVLKLLQRLETIRRMSANRPKNT